MPRRTIPRVLQEQVLVMARRRCCVCFGLNRDTEEKIGQIAHLDGDPDNNDLDNLAFLCLEHHDHLDTKRSQSKGLTREEVRRFRRELHEALEGAFRLPIRIGRLQVRAPGDPTGVYLRDGKFESAWLKVRLLPSGNRVSVDGFALWGKGNRFGPSMGDLHFKAALSANRVVHTERNLERLYRLEMVFSEDGLVATEDNVLGMFGMNVCFEGQYRRKDQ